MPKIPYILISPLRLTSNLREDQGKQDCAPLFLAIQGPLHLERRKVILEKRPKHACLSLNLGKAILFPLLWNVLGWGTFGNSFQWRYILTRTWVWRLRFNVSFLPLWSYLSSVSLGCSILCTNGDDYNATFIMQGCCEGYAEPPTALSSDSLSLYTWGQKCPAEGHTWMKECWGCTVLARRILSGLLTSDFALTLSAVSSGLPTPLPNSQFFVPIPSFPTPTCLFNSLL